MADSLWDLLDFSGTLFVVAYHGSWMAVTLGIGIVVGWRMAGETSRRGQPQLPEDQQPPVPARSEEGA